MKHHAESEAAGMSGVRRKFGSDSKCIDLLKANI